MTLRHRTSTVIWDLDKIPQQINNPENVVIRNGKQRVDIGCICYSEVGYYDASINGLNGRDRLGKTVNPSSFDPSRRKVAIAIIEIMRDSEKKLDDRRDFATRQIKLFSEALNQGYSVDTLEKAIETGLQMTLQFDREIKDGTSRKTARSRDRRALIDVLAQMFGQDTKPLLREMIPPVGKLERQKAYRKPKKAEVNPNLEFRSNAFLLDVTDKTTEIFEPENVVLKVGEQEIDVGALCYKVTGIYDASRQFDRKGYRLGMSVDLQTFAPSRRGIVQHIINFARSSTCAQTTIFSIVGRQVKVLRELTDNGQSLETLESAKEALKRLSFDYRDKMTRRVKGSTKASLSNYLSAIIKLASHIHCIPEAEFKRGMVKLKGRSSHHNEAPIKEDRNRSVWAYLNLFTRISDGLMSEEKFPYCIDFRSIIENHKPIWLGGLQASAKRNEIFDLVLGEFGTFPSFREIEARYHNSSLITPLAHVKQRYKDWSKTVNTANEPFSKAKLAMVNTALGAYYLTFCGVSAMNSSIARTLENFAPDETTKGMQHLEPHKFELGETPENHRASRSWKFCGLKYRASGREVYPEIGKQFIPYHKDYLRFIEWVKTEYGVDTGNKVFFALGSLTARNFKNVEVVQYPQAESITISKIRNLIKTRCHKNLLWISPRPLRLAISSGLLMDNATPTQVAQKLQNTPTTVIQSYAKVAKEKGRIEMAEYFNELSKWAISRGRNQTNPIPVTIEEKSRHDTPVGGCDAKDTSEAGLAKGFNKLAPEPVCGQAETCFFCKHYRVHVAKEDIHNILSIQKLIEMAENRVQNAEHFETTYTPILYRVNEILEYIIGKQPDLKDVLSQIKEQVSKGELSTHWQTHYELIQDLKEAI